jgi:hypothetical protein
MPADDAPAFPSLALDAIPRPDHVDVIAVALHRAARRLTPGR